MTVTPILRDVAARRSREREDAQGASIPPLTAQERLELLCDVGSLRTIRSTVSSRRMGEKARAGDGVVAGAGEIDGRPIFCYAQDARFAGGSLGEAHANSIVRVLELAGTARVPVIGFVESGGARMQEGTAALAGYGRIFRQNVALSGQVPQISVISGTSAGGGSYSPALTDFVMMTKSASMFLTGPGVVRRGAGRGGQRGGARRLRGARAQRRLPVRGRGRRRVDLPGARAALVPAAERVRARPRAPVRPRDRRRPGRLRARGAAARVRRARRGPPRGGRRQAARGGRALGAQHGRARFARIDGPLRGHRRQPARATSAACIDSEAAQKAARFVRTCNSFGLPLVVLVDTPGFMPGTKQESSGVIRHGAKLLHAFAEATVPKLTVVLRKAYGGAYITMNSKDLGADLAFAWPRGRDRRHGRKPGGRA